MPDSVLLRLCDVDDSGERLNMLFIFPLLLLRMVTLLFPSESALDPGSEVRDEEMTDGASGFGRVFLRSVR
jgi:hypothetical protein